MLTKQARLRRCSAVGLLTGPDLARAAEVEYVACVHCGKQHPVRASIEALLRGQQVLGLCTRCNGPHCPECAECVPMERQLENIEAGRDPLDTSRLSLAFPQSPPQAGSRLIVPAPPGS